MNWVVANPSKEATVAPCSNNWTVWVDPTTYLPVQSVTTMPGGGSSESSFKWLTPVAANLTQLDAPIPTGFTESSGPVDQPAPRGNSVWDGGMCW